MSRRNLSPTARQPEPAPVFAALGDPTRLALVAKLSRGGASSIVQLTEGTELSRQAVTKHLKILEQAGIVHSVRSGRESRYELDPAPLAEVKDYLDRVSAEWDQALMRLKAFVEE
ncbi:ArsR/SmtB family transcription factor [Geomesophilobacter sediminis]|uniref:Winged helix-turn-helix transcriptional regulator n=1 Tax=Geomesophilobacter sediminis TaxID=2798584 RepID=A0A8J7JL82_9BACT|nr:metalloregulator ArsR/SmtB family transcription factor [Geomesophilobacter sediminis]MBJ6724595.1 winged helix-turn-helix transcriptional regulator [Geomesophilobacter sediminis]